MILIDSLYINNGGGKILLDYFVNECEKTNIDVFYLFDKRCENSYKEISDEKKVFLKASMYLRFLFYTKNKNRFSKVLCFGNQPPLLKLNCPVFTYFHQPMFLNIPKEFSFKDKLIFSIKQNILNRLRKNTDKWIVQNNLIKNGLCDKYRIAQTEVLVLPFYPNEDLSVNSEIRQSNTFIYVSNATPHKNHKRLFEAFTTFYDQHKVGELIVTINFDHDMAAYVEKMRMLKYPITNIGFVDRVELIKNYHTAEYLIFPSLEESFGLGIVEAIECGCKVIGSDLGYMFQVCQPSIVFNPLSKDDIICAFEKATEKQENATKQNIFNKIDELMLLLKN
ncbi:glycosyltransferase [Chryseobacterium indoltheticum]|jgi:glycosyltransferase involved in cell wall biosynthesis|uniref:glycosyltransferase n=1 Tax=Chryseobacterium indoltheticum TaxID=254 RepID=UPI00242F6965|nr:glycosyltransferase [Chryseobacterium indoltheticum]MDF2832915.1 hypothetical protein [Chryseobacterium indoltheticum]